jgi:hypothetical protein
MSRGNLRVCSLANVRMHYENDGDTSWVCCFCLLRDGAKGRVYEEEEDLPRNGDLPSCVSHNHDFGLSQRESLIKAIPNRRSCNACRHQ